MSTAEEERVADYVLGLMEAGEAAAFERALAADPAMAREVSAALEDLHALDATAPALAPDAGLWPDIARRLAAVRPPAPTPRARPAAEAQAGVWESLAFWRWLGGAGAAATAVLAGTLAVLALQPAPAPQFVAILTAPDGSATGALVEVDAGGAARLIPLRDVPVPEGRALQVWTLQDRAQGPVSVGLIGEARRVSLDLGPALRPTRADQLFEITLEPQAGSPTGRPTGPVLFKGLTLQTL